MNRFNGHKIKTIGFSLVMGILMGLSGCGEANLTTPNTASPAPGGGAVTQTDQELITETIKNGAQKTTFLLTDAPSDDFKSVVVDIQSPIIVTMDNGGTVNVPLPDNLPIRVDLLELEGVSDLLASAELPAGTISKVALTMANPEITLLDDTVLPSSGIDLPNPVLVISPRDTASGLPTGIIIPAGKGTTVQIDIDVEASIHIDVTATGRPIFRPVGEVARVDDTTHPDGVEVKQIKGEIVEIPGIPEHPKSFILKHHGRRHFVPVDANDATIANFNGEVRFDALEKGQIVEVGGVVKNHLLKARRILILPKDHRALHGIVTHLNPAAHSFDLVFWRQHDREKEHKEKGIKQVTVFYTDNTPILLHDPNQKLTTRDLTNGQLVWVKGGVNREAQTVDARVIVLQTEQFRGFIVAEPDCGQKLIRVANPTWHLHRLRIAGIELAPHRSGIVDIADARLFGRHGQALNCKDLVRGSAVSVFGRMIPHEPTPDDPNPIRIKAFRVRQAKGRHVGGEVVSVALDGTSLILKVPAGMHGFDRLNQACNKTTTGQGAPVIIDDGGLSIVPECDHFKLKIVLSENLYNPDAIVFNQDLIGKTIHAAGFFESKQRAANDTRRHHYFFAIAVKKGPAPVDPTDQAGTLTGAGGVTGTP